MTVLASFFFQLVLPFMIVIYTLSMLILLPVPILLSLGVLIYLVYLLMTLVLYFTGLVLISERPKQDLRLLLVVPVFPLFMFALRCWGVVCVLNEVVRRGHEESGMAPWWVLKKGKRF